MRHHSLMNGCYPMCTECEMSDRQCSLMTSPYSSPLDSLSLMSPTATDRACAPTPPTSAFEVSTSSACHQDCSCSRISLNKDWVKITHLGNYEPWRHGLFPARSTMFSMLTILQIIPSFYYYNHYYYYYYHYHYHYYHYHYYLLLLLLLSLLLLFLTLK